MPRAAMCHRPGQERRNTNLKACFPYIRTHDMRQCLQLLRVVLVSKKHKHGRTGSHRRYDPATVGCCFGVGCSRPTEGNASSTLALYVCHRAGLLGVMGERNWTCKLGAQPPAKPTTTCTPNCSPATPIRQHASTVRSEKGQPHMRKTPRWSLNINIPQPRFALGNSHDL